jgi:hypothetical protein
VNWQNHLLGGWTVQQWRSKVDDCTPTSVEFNLCPGDDEGAKLTAEACSLLPDDFDIQEMLGHMARRSLILPGNSSSLSNSKPGTWL